jgi:hypothetical protein
MTQELIQRVFLPYLYSDALGQGNDFARLELTGEAGREKWREYADKIDALPEIKAVVHHLGPSGAQHGAAMNLASIFARNGYAKGMEMVPEDRRIQVSKNFPTLDGKTAA